MKITKLDVQFALLMSSLTTFFVTFVLVAVNLGFTEQFLFVWMRSWAIAAAMVALSILFVAPKIRAFLIKKIATKHNIS